VSQQHIITCFHLLLCQLNKTELPEDSDTSVYQGAYKQKRAAYAQQLAKDAAAAPEDDEEQYEAVDEESGDENLENNTSLIRQTSKRTSRKHLISMGLFEV
jgi:predicted extracellular nuclease